MDFTSITHPSQHAEKACLDFWTFHYKWSQQKKGSKASCGAEEESQAEADARVRADCAWLTWWLPLLCSYFTLVCLILIESDKSLNVAEDGGGRLAGKAAGKSPLLALIAPGYGAALLAMHRSCFWCTHVRVIPADKQCQTELDI